MKVRDLEQGRVLEINALDRVDPAGDGGPEDTTWRAKGRAHNLE